MIEDVLDFHHVFKLPIKAYPGFPSIERVSLRKRLIDEEVNKELLPAIDAQDLAGVADGIADAIYVLLGTALEFGIPIEEVWRLVHESNMKKVGGGTRADGKILKPEGWTPPDVRGALLDDGWEP